MTVTFESMIKTIEAVGKAFVPRAQKSAPVQREIDRAIKDGTIIVLSQQHDGTWFSFPRRAVGHPRISSDGERLVRFTVTLTVQQKSALDALPPGTASATVRAALAAYGIGDEAAGR